MAEVDVGVVDVTKEAFVDETPADEELELETSVKFCVSKLNVYLHAGTASCC